MRQAGYDGSVIFMQSKDRDLVLPSGLLEETGFEEKTSYFKNLDTMFPSLAPVRHGYSRCVQKTGSPLV